VRPEAPSSLQDPGGYQCEERKLVQLNSRSKGSLHWGLRPMQRGQPRPSCLGVETGPSLRPVKNKVSIFKLSIMKNFKQKIKNKNILY
jgi:hypothetical protein